MLEFLTSWWNTDTPRKHVLGFYEAMRPIHKALCQKWYQNIAMQSGGAGQWATYKNNSTTLSVESAPVWRVRATFNKILPLSITQRQKLMPENPNITTRPANLLSDEDKKNAELARLLLRAKWTETDFQAELEEMTLGMVPCSIGYLLTLWDGKAGAEIAPGVGTGKVVITAGSPFEIIPDFSVSRFADCTRFMRVKVRSLEYIEHKYGKKVKAQTLDPQSIFQIKAQALITGSQSDMMKTLENHALVMDMFELPSVKYPQGFHHICTEDEDLIEPGTLDPYYIQKPDGSKEYFLPLDSAQMIRLYGVLVGTNSVEQATAPQCYLNQGKSTILENIKRLSRPKILAPEGAIAKGAMIEDPAEIIVEFNPEVQGAITPLKPPEMAQYHLDFIRSLPAEIQDAFGIHDATQGVLPRRATSGKAIGFLTAQDDERHFDPRKDIDRAIAGAFRKALNIHANAASEQETKDLIGDDGKLVDSVLRGAQLRAVDVDITRDTSLPKDAGSRMDLAMEILDKKATREQMEIVFAIMKAKNVEDLEAILKGNTMAEEIYVRMENYDMAKGLERPVSPGENHQMHIKGHEQQLRNPNIRADLKMFIMKHIADHRAQEGLEAANAMPQAEPGAELVPPAGGEVLPGAAIPAGEAVPPEGMTV